MKKKIPDWDSSRWGLIFSLIVTSVGVVYYQAERITTILNSDSNQQHEIDRLRDSVYAMNKDKPCERDRN